MRCDHHTDKFIRENEENVAVITIPNDIIKCGGAKTDGKERVIDSYNIGDSIIYANGDRYEMGRIKSVCDDGCFVRLGLIVEYEVSKENLCKQAQSICNHDCGHCAWQTEREGE